jgi:hypothetical protein
MEDLETLLRYMTLKELRKMQRIIDVLIVAKEKQIKLILDTVDIKIKEK